MTPETEGDISLAARVLTVCCILLTISGSMCMFKYLFT